MVYGTTMNRTMMLAYPGAFGGSGGCPDFIPMSTFISEPGTRLGGRYRLEDRMQRQRRLVGLGKQLTRRWPGRSRVLTLRTGLPAHP